MKVLICVDYGLTGERVLEKSSSFLANLNSSNVYVYSVMDLQIAASSELAIETLEKESRELALLAAKTFIRPISFSTDTGNPVECILNKAQTIQCDLLILGTHGRTGLDHVLLGSVAERVLRKIKCNTLVIPVKDLK